MASRTLQSNSVRRPQSASIAFIAVTLLAALAAPAFVQASSDSPDRTLQASVKPGPDGPVVKITDVERTALNEQLYVDVAGVRLYATDSDTRQRLRYQISQAGRARHIVASLMDAALRESGVEPTMIPVQGEQGRRSGTDNMVLLADGEFTRTGQFWDSTGGGLSEDQKLSQGARYQVRLSSFYIDRYKVTNEDYCRFLNDGNAGYWTPWNLRIGRSAVGRNAGKFVPADRSLSRHPVVLVNWFQARGFAEWAGKRLPTEAEWEYAAGGREGRTYPWGNEPPDESRADFPVKFRHTVPVDMFPSGATPEGVYQMAGNSAEWVSDYFDNSTYRQAPEGGVAVDPTGPESGFFPDAWYRYRVMFKGWCKSNRADYFTCTKRHGRGPFEDASAGVSFRCVKDAEK